MDTKADFFKTIWTHYNEISQAIVPTELLDKLSDQITDHFYEQYTRFGNQYPKSKKRYSTFLIKDLEHPTTYEIVINFFKEAFGSNYSVYSKVILKMSDLELITFEKNREEFYKMF